MLEMSQVACSDANGQLVSAQVWGRDVGNDDHIISTYNIANFLGTYDLESHHLGSNPVFAMF